MNTYLEGRVRNTSLPLSQCLMPLFEAVVNSIHAAEDLPACDRGKIVVTLNREPVQSEFEETKMGGRSPIPKIVDFYIQDNGCGFDDVNFNAFMTLDTPHKVQKGCKGMGRLLWLKAFEKVEIESTYIESGVWKRRIFDFSLPDGVKNVETETLQGQNNYRKTIIRLRGFKAEYQKKSHKNTANIAQDVLNQCMWYYLRDGQMPDIDVKDENETYSLINLYEENIDKQAKRETISIKGHSFELLHIKFRSDIKESAAISYCANNRLVIEEKLSSYDKLFSHKLNDSNGDYSYQCYITSPVLDKCVVSDRTEFDFELDSELLGGMSISKEEINEGIVSKIREHLSEDIEKLKEATKHRVNAFVEEKAPRYRGVINSLQPGELTPSSSEKEIELKLHEKLYEVETSILKEGQSLLSVPLDTDAETFKEKMDDFIRKINTVKSSDLASYVFYRKMVLDLLRIVIQMNENDKYAKEESVHNLVFPMRTTSDGSERLNENLWIIDERLVFHHYLASDKSITSLPITTAKDRKEPDIVAMRINSHAPYETNLTNTPILVAETADGKNPASLTIVEFKRPMRNDKENPFDQVYTYCEKIKSGKITTKDGRPIPNAERLPCYVYIIADITDSMKKLCKREDLKESYDGMGYFGYKSNYGLYIEVISYDKLLIAAKERNYAYFDKLGVTSI